MNELRIMFDAKKFFGLVAALALFIGSWILLHWLGSALFGGVKEGVQHLVHMLIFGSVALLVISANFYCILFTPLQKAVLPDADALLEIEKKWRLGTITAQDVEYAKACAINSGCRVIAFLIAWALVTTPL